VAVLATNAVYVLLAVIVGFSRLPAALAAALGVVAFVLAALSASLWLGGRRLRVASIAGRFLSRDFGATDDRVIWLLGAMRKRWLAISAPMLGAWILEAVESFVILRLVGIALPFSAVLAMDVSISVLRNVVVVVPAGLGIQDAGWAAWLAASGVPDPASGAAAFVLVKRAKEAAFALTGYVFLALRSSMTKGTPSPRAAALEAGRA
jgi:hypothetical protein